MFIVHISEYFLRVFQKLFQNFPNFFRNFIKFLLNFSIVSLKIFQIFLCLIRIYPVIFPRLLQKSLKSSWKISKIFSKFLKNYSPITWERSYKFKTFQSFFTACLLFTFLHTFLVFPCIKPFSKLFQNFSQFHRISVQFLHSYCSFSKVNITFPHRFSVKSHRNLSGKFVKFSSKYFLNVYKEFPRYFP